MAIISDNKSLGPKKEFPIASEGVALIVLADVEDLGIRDTGLYGPKPQVALTWVVDEKDPDGNFFVIRRTFTNSLHEKSNLYPVVTDMLGNTPPIPYNLELLLGKINMGVIKHKAGTGKNEGRTFANIATFLTAKPGQTFAIPASFVRAKDGGSYGKLPDKKQNNRPAETSQPRTAQAQLPANQEVADEDIPF